MCRNTSSDKLRAAERLELNKYLNDIGLGQRVFFWGIKPHIDSNKVRLIKWPA